MKFRIGLTVKYLSLIYFGRCRSSMTPDLLENQIELPNNLINISPHREVTALKI